MDTVTADALQNKQPRQSDRIAQLRTLLWQVRFVLLDSHAKNPECGHHKMAMACEAAADELGRLHGALREIMAYDPSFSWGIAHDTLADEASGLTADAAAQGTASEVTVS